ncbi:MAG: metallopeptidase family protein [Pseudomonadota bacterium]
MDMWPGTDPDLDTFTALAVAALRNLPREFKALTGNLELRTAEWPTDDALQSVGLTHPLDLLGLFEGFGMTEAAWSAPTGVFPNRIWLYRSPILAFTAEGEDTLEAVITHVLVHEIGHHFGLSDDDMEAIDNA